MKRDMWISYYLQDGTQLGASLEVENVDEAEAILMEKHGDMYGDIADYGFWDEFD